MAGRPRKAAASAAASTEEVGERWIVFTQWLKDNGHGDHDPTEMKLAVQKYVHFQKSDANKALNSTRGSKAEDSAAAASVPAEGARRGRGRKATTGPSEDAASRPTGGRGARKTTAGRRGSRTAESV